LHPFALQSLSRVPFVLFDFSFHSSSFVFLASLFLFPPLFFFSFLFFSFLSFFFLVLSVLYERGTDALANIADANATPGRAFGNR